MGSEMPYKSNHLLFRDLTDQEVADFQRSAVKLCRDGFSFHALDMIHPVVRLEIIKTLRDRLRLQNLHSRVTKDSVLSYIDDTIDQITNGNLTLGCVGSRLLGLQDSIAIIKTIRARVELMQDDT